MNELDAARYVSLTTFTRDGTPKATPVWITGRGGSYRFYTGASSWKVKRLGNDANVELRVCDLRGRIQPHTPVHHGTARVMSDDAAVRDVKDAVLDKYGWQARLVRLTDAVKDRLGRGEDPVAVEIEMTA